MLATQIRKFSLPIGEDELSMVNVYIAIEDCRRGEFPTEGTKECLNSLCKKDLMATMHSKDPVDISKYIALKLGRYIMEQEIDINILMLKVETVVYIGGVATIGEFILERDNLILETREDENTPKM